MAYLSGLITVIGIYCGTYAFAQQCEQSSDVARFDCYPENNPTQQACEARKCCWRPLVEPSIGNIAVPNCYYPLDFPNYEVTSNDQTDFGQRIQIVKSQTTYMPNEILRLTVDLVYETQQRLRVRIYDPTSKRYEVPLEVPIVEKKADMTDYNIVVNSKPFSIVVTRKSTSVVL